MSTVALVQNASDTQQPTVDPVSLSSSDLPEQLPPRADDTALCLQSVEPVLLRWGQVDTERHFSQNNRPTK